MKSMKLKFNNNILNAIVLGVTLGGTAQLANASESEYETRVYKTDTSGLTLACDSNVFSTMRPLPEGVSSIKVSRDRVNRTFEIEVVQKKGDLQNASVGIVCITTLANGSRTVFPAGKISFP